MEFPLIPDALIPFSVADQLLWNRNVIEVMPLLPIVADDDSIEAMLCVPYVPQTPYSLPKRVIYKRIDEEDAANVPWMHQERTHPNYLYIVSRGIYRIANEFSARRGMRSIALTKYFGLEAARARLEGDSSHGNSSLHTSNILELTYLGCFKRNMEFLLYNNRDSIAIVRKLRIVVHTITLRPIEVVRSIPVEAMLSEYRFEVTLSPEATEVVVTDQQFKYSPGDVDKFSIEFRSSEAGYDYELSLKIDWLDVRSGITRTLETPKERIEFPE